MRGCPANRVAAGHMLVLSAAVELVVLLVEAVHQVPGAGVRRVADAVDLVVSCRGGRLLTCASRWMDHENLPSGGAGVRFGIRPFRHDRDGTWGGEVSEHDASSRALPGGARPRLPVGFQVVLGAGGLVGLLVVCMLVAIVLVVGLKAGEPRLNGRDVSYASAVAAAALGAKGIANDERGFLLTGDWGFIGEAGHRVRGAWAALAAAVSAADGPA
jgi:hypothetical protein